MGLFEEIVRSFLAHEGGSDIHISPGNPIAFRLNGRITPWDKGIAPTEEQTRAIKGEIWKMLPFQLREYHDRRVAEKGHTGVSVETGGVRFRVNVARLGEGYHIVLRVLPVDPPRITDLGFNEKTEKALRWIAGRRAGFFLVVGATGSGKSTTLAALIRTIAESREVHIITLEDPIEYRFRSDRALIVQKELGRDFPRFAEGLHSALREDPDVILVGEIRDRESLDLALKASETGHLVFGTLHTQDAVTTINRMAAMVDNPVFLRDRLAQTFLGVIAQTLYVDRKGRKRVCWEILVANQAVRAMIREGNDLQVKSVLDTLPMSQSFATTVREHFEAGWMDRETAERIAPDAFKGEGEGGFVSAARARGGGDVERMVTAAAVAGVLKL
ncbi:type IV pilus twitching motility protein PilT [Thermosulfurimonas sp. F29]|uniref:type IV pilus twitching motility protein PilT n=1 Tax=Thermosulfurimonas sp. F29 TaxID=2867247 RepID=UPI001C83684F|nr:ATPase, T2SS/T4P/T4SS family [Thermosulfurimonas sp. F29]MBX6424117.1 Flp pilus assembly complex ATPase component TadA [Thermosulfurimonas sp. F29]